MQRVPTARIFRDGDRYGFEFRFEGKPVHHRMVVFDSVANCLEWCDGHRERVWDPAPENGDGTLMTSTGYVEGSAPWQLSRRA